MANEEYATFAQTDVRLKLQIVARPSRGRNRKVLFSQEIENPELNEPIRLNLPAGLDLPYLTPLSASIQVLSGDASALSDAILSLRFRPRRQVSGGAKS